MKLAIKIIGFLLIPADSTSPIIDWNVEICEELQSIDRASSWIERILNENVPEDLMRTFDELVKTQPPENNAKCGFAYVTLIETFANWFFKQHLYDPEYVLAIQSRVSATESGGYCAKFKETMEKLWFEKPMDPSYTLHRWLLCPQVYLGFARPDARWIFLMGQSNPTDVLATLFSSQTGDGDRIERLNDAWNFLGLQTHDTKALEAIVRSFVIASGLSLDELPTTFDNGTLFIGAKRLCKTPEEQRLWSWCIAWLCGASLETIVRNGYLSSPMSAQEWERYKYPEMIEWALDPQNAEHRDQAISTLAEHISRFGLEGLGSVPLVEFKSSMRNLDRLCNHLPHEGPHAATDAFLLICQFPTKATCHKMNRLSDFADFAGSDLCMLHSISLSMEMNMWSEAGLFTFLAAEPDCQNKVVEYISSCLPNQLTLVYAGEQALSIPEIDVEINKVPIVRDVFCSRNEDQLVSLVNKDPQSEMGQWLPIVCPNIDIALTTLKEWARQVYPVPFHGVVEIRSSHVLDDSLPVLLDKYTSWFQGIPRISLDGEVGTGVNPRWAKAFIDALYDETGSMKSDLSHDVYFALGRLIVFCIRAGQPIGLKIPTIWITSILHTNQAVSLHDFNYDFSAKCTDLVTIIRNALGAVEEEKYSFPELPGVEHIVTRSTVATVVKSVMLTYIPPFVVHIGRGIDSIISVEALAESGVSARALSLFLGSDEHY